MTPTIESGRNADLNGSLMQKLVAQIIPGLRLSSKQNNYYDGNVNGKIIEIKACQKDVGTRSGRFTLKKKQHYKLVAASADYVFIVHSNTELIFYLRIPASKVPYDTEVKQKCITWHCLPKLVTGS